MQQPAVIIYYLYILQEYHKYLIIINMAEKAILNRIKIALVERQLSSKWLAEKMGKSEATVSRWASNKIQPSLEQLYEIAELLDMNVKDLINANQIH